MTDEQLKQAQHSAYKECIKHCRERGHWATYTALTEDGFDLKVDWIAMLKSWEKSQ
jgi:hypothetical protein